MSPLSKAFVVLATLLSVVFVSLTVAHVARSEDYRAEYEVMKADRDAALARATKAEAEDSAELARLSQARADSEDSVSVVNAELQGRLTDIRTMAERISTLESEKARDNAAIAAMSETLASTTERLKAQDEQIRSLITDLAAVSRQKSEVEQRLVVVQGRSDRYENDVRRLQEQLQAAETALGETQAELERVRIALDELDIDPDNLPSRATRIAGAVTSVDHVGDGLTLVQVNVGTRDGVREDMPFTIFRGSQYIGTIKIKTIDTNSAVGEVDLSVDEIRSGDSIHTR